eukprot:1323792-Lingulodinium_polyedra.AAC.1
MVALYNPDDAETWVPQTLLPDTMPRSTLSWKHHPPVDAFRIAEQQVPDFDDHEELLCYNTVLILPTPITCRCRT